MRRGSSLGWKQLAELTAGTPTSDLINGPTNAQSRLRLFGQDESMVRVTLFRDNHAWCPYCQKIWLWLEEKQLPYRVEKVTMFCYGQKEAWYKKIVPNGMLPALKLDDTIITESDDIISALESSFGPLDDGRSMSDPEVIAMRRLERLLFRAWCQWLCYPARSQREEAQNKATFQRAIDQVEAVLGQTPGPYFLGDTFSVADIVFTPYVERMNASLFYYKGYDMRGSDPKGRDRKNVGLSRWFDAMETRETYRGTQSDFHTHCHDLPPQMGGCYESGDQWQQRCKALVDEGPWDSVHSEVGEGVPASPSDSTIAALRVMRHKESIVLVNPGPDDVVDEALRCAVARLLTGESAPPPPGSSKFLRYIRDRISVPRDMPVHAARLFKKALEDTAALQDDDDCQEYPIPFDHRRDQNPGNFRLVH